MPVPRLRPVRRAAAVAGVVAVAVALSVLGGCSGRPSEAERRADLVREARSTIGEYVADLDRGDIAAADELRCRAARLAPEEQQAYLAPVVDDLRAALGRLRVESLRLVSSIDGVTHVTVRLVGAPAPTHPALVEEDGRLRLCGASVDGAAELRASAKTRDGSDATSAVPLDDLVGIAPVPGFERAPGEALPPGLLDQLDGFVDARGATWTGPAGRTVSITVVDLRTPDQARAAQQALESELQDVVTGLVDGPMAAARGFRYVAGYQLFLQPPGVGSVGDYVGFRWGSRVAAIYVVPLAADDGHDLVLAAARAVAAASGVP